MATNSWNNADGLFIPFPGFFADKYNYKNRLTTVVTSGCVKQAEMDIDLTLLTSGIPSYTTDIANTGTRSGFNTGDDRLPADSAIIKVDAVVREAAVGGTSFTLGTFQLNGTAINATGLLTATDGSLANMAAIGNKVVGSGAYTNTASGTGGLGPLDSYVGVTATGVFTAGKLRLYISYLDPHADVDITR